MPAIRHTRYRVTITVEAVDALTREPEFTHEETIAYELDSTQHPTRALQVESIVSSTAALFAPRMTGTFRD